MRGHTTSGKRCIVCGLAANDSDDYTDGGVVVCKKCALAPLAARFGGVQAGLYEGEADPTKAACCVAVDAAAHRLWLSGPVHFEGNRDVIVDASFTLLDQLASVLKKHPSIAIRLEGHTNSKCGLQCDGSYVCANNRCAKDFGGVGARQRSRAGGPRPSRATWKGRFGRKGATRASPVRGARRRHGGAPEARTGASRCAPWRSTFCIVFGLLGSSRVCGEHRGRTGCRGGRHRALPIDASPIHRRRGSRLSQRTSYSVRLFLYGARGVLQEPRASGHNTLASTGLQSVRWTRPLLPVDQRVRLFSMIDRSSSSAATYTARRPAPEPGGEAALLTEFAARRE